MDIATAPYKSRPVRFLKLCEVGAWRVKMYGISSLGETPAPEFIKVAEDIALRTLPQPALNRSRYGIAFVTIHQAEMFNQIIVDWWEHVNELRHHVFKAYPERPYSFEEITASGEAFCIWELRVIGFERDARVDSVLKNSAGKALDDYLNRRLDADA